MEGGGAVEFYPWGFGDLSLEVGECKGEGSDACGFEAEVPLAVEGDIER